MIAMMRLLMSLAKIFVRIGLLSAWNSSVGVYQTSRGNLSWCRWRFSRPSPEVYANTNTNYSYSTNSDAYSNTDLSALR